MYISSIVAAVKDLALWAASEVLALWQVLRPIVFEVAVRVAWAIFEGVFQLGPDAA